MSQVETLTRELQAAFARYLGLPPAEVDPEEPIELFGLDSLTAAQLALDIEDRIGVSVFVTELSGEETIASLAASAARQLDQHMASADG